MNILQQTASLQTNSAKTSDWIGQVNGIIYAYDFNCQESQSTGNEAPFSKEKFEHDLKRISQKVKK